MRATAWQPGLGTAQRTVAVVRRTTRALWTVRTKAADEPDEDVVDATPEHPFFVVGRGWRRADQLVQGDELSGLRGRRRVERAEGRQVPETPVFNLKVENVSTYRVGRASQLVHNGGPCVPAVREAAAQSTAVQLAKQVANVRHQVGVLAVQRHLIEQITGMLPRGSAFEGPLRMAQDAEKTQAAAVQNAVSEANTSFAKLPAADFERQLKDIRNELEKEATPQQLAVRAYAPKPQEAYDAASAKIVKDVTGSDELRQSYGTPELDAEVSARHFKIFSTRLKMRAAANKWLWTGGFTKAYEKTLNETLGGADIPNDLKTFVRDEGETGGITPGGARIALGLGGRRGPHTRLLPQFAKEHKANWWGEWWFGSIGDYQDFHECFLTVIPNRANRIFFNLTGIDDPVAAANKAIHDGGFYTEWELHQIRTHPEWWDRITFFKDTGEGPKGAVVQNPFSLTSGL